MNFFENVTSEKQQAFIVDNRIVPEELDFIVYLLGEECIKISLTHQQPFVEYESYKMSVINEQLYVNGERLEAGLQELDGRKLFVISRENTTTKQFTLNAGESCVISADEHADIRIGQTNRFILEQDFLIVHDVDDFAYLNQKPVVTNQHLAIQVGDTLLTPYFLLEKRANYWRLNAFTEDFSLNPEKIFQLEVADKSDYQFPDYSRKPRLNLEIAEKDFTIYSIEKGPNLQRNGLLKAIVPPLAMLGMTVLVTVLSGRNPIMMLTMGTMSVVTVTFSISQYITDKREAKADKLRRQADYQFYLVNTLGDLTRAYNREKEILEYQYPSPKELMQAIYEWDGRIYERQSYNKDFLEVSLGLSNQPSHLDIKMDVNPRDMSREAEELRQLQKRFSTQRDIPTAISLFGQTLGLVATREVASPFIESLLLQVAFFHSYHDVNMISLIPRKNYQETWKKWRLLPHYKLQGLNVRGLVYSNQTKDIVLNGFYQILMRRKQVLQEAGREKPQFLPHYILTIFDDSYLVGHQLNELLAEDMGDLGVTVIWSKESANHLPETITTLIELPNTQNGRLITENNIYVQRDFKSYPKDPALETSIRRLSNLRHIEVEKNAVPESLGLLEQYDVKTVEELQIGMRWSQAEPNKSIRSMIGWRGKSDYVYWDLHERAHGPHALVGGTTGSGKSEFLTTYLIGLAINFSPEDIGMLIIDWKGGGIANTLDKLPHFMGAITNLDGAGTARALASIKAELDKRQREFAKYGVNNINAYMSLYKQRNNPKPDIIYPHKPLPHLILVSDEFAELKSNVPEFLDELTSVARIGRSLGVHLILATQKPSGVVNDQIEANSTSKVALKMASTQDSNELLKTPDAAHITNPGRGYLKVGQNEVYELFQSGYAGLPYDPDGVEAEVLDERIFRINDLGQYELLYDPGEEVVQGHDTSELPTQLEAVIEEINQVFASSALPKPERPWLPNLEEHVVSPSVKQSDKRNLSVPLSLVDLPTEQLQENFDFDLEKRGHTVIFAGPGYGKTTVLQTLALNLARQNTPDMVQFHLLDFGNNGLLPLKNLPHVSDIVTLEEDEKLQKMMTRISQELASRKSLFRQVGAANLSQYEAKTKQSLPIILHLVDSYDGLAAEDRRKEKIDSLLLQVLREGAALGLYLIFTANRTGSVRMNMMSNISTKIALYLNDENELSTLMGKDRVMQEAITGRGQMLLDVPRAMQIYQPAAGQNGAEILYHLEEIVNQLDKEWDGARPAAIPMVPEQLTPREFLTYLPEPEKGMIHLGLNKYSVAVESIRLFQGRPIGLFSESQRQAHLVMAQIMAQLTSDNGVDELILIDVHGSFDRYQKQVSLYIGRETVISDYLQLKEALEALKTASAVNRIVVINGLNDLLEKAFYQVDDIARLLSNNPPHLQWIVLDSIAKVGNTYGNLTSMAREFIPELLFGGNLQTQRFIEQLSTEKKNEVFKTNVIHRLVEEKLIHIVVPESEERA